MSQDDAKEIYSEYAERTRSDAPASGAHEPEARDAPDEGRAGGIDEPHREHEPEARDAPDEGRAGGEQSAAEARSAGGDPRDSGDVILIGMKPIMTYVNATMTRLASRSKVTIMARGRRITQAVDVSQMIVKRMNSVGYKVAGIRLATDMITNEQGRRRGVSTIEIDISKSA